MGGPAQPLRLKRDRASAREGVLDRGRVFLTIRQNRGAVALGRGHFATRPGKRTRDFLAGFVEDRFVGRIFPFYELFDDAKSRLRSRS